ncbi:hypothetical protein ACOMHN_048878 [Nucella lapillus]
MRQQKKKNPKNTVCSEVNGLLRCIAPALGVSAEIITLCAVSCLEDSSRQISQVSVLYDGNSPCGVRMGSGGLQNWSAEHTIRLVASVDGRQDKAQQANVSIYADVYHWEGTANTTGKWVKDHTSKLATYEVLVSYQQCTSAATCTCSVKVATKGANVTFERCRQVGEPGPPEDIHITRSGNGTAQGMQVYRHQNLKSYFVVLPTGTIVTIKESLYYLDVWVSASTLDFGKTEGEQITQLLATADNSAPSTKTRRRRAASGIDFATNFTQATSTCEVKGRCYMPAEASPTDHCLFCEPRKSATKWSVKDLPECEDRRDSSSDDDDTEQVSPLMVAILAVGAGLLIVAVIGVAVCFLKKRRGRPSGSDQDMGCPPPSYDNHGYASSSQMEPQQFFNHGSIHKRAVTHESAYIPSTVQTD